ncbi:MAG: hypothetical protein ACD_62C00484G0001 [uncultured bacterium]|nr:MAG: hypothetical protein ACD_62C00484G0001 [uncultured bacterium]
MFYDLPRKIEIEIFFGCGFAFGHHLTSRQIKRTCIGLLNQQTTA